jgi:hypothetical protein
MSRILSEPLMMRLLAADDWVQHVNCNKRHTTAEVIRYYKQQHEMQHYWTAACKV